MFIVQPQQLLNTSIGETVMLQCKAISYGSTDSLKYQWFRVIDDDYKKVSINGANSSELVIIHVMSEDDSTSYQCAATNENGTTFSRIARINSKMSIS